MDIIEKIKKKGVTAGDLSKETGIPISRIYKWFDGTAQPKYGDVNKLEQFLKIPAMNQMGEPSQDSNQRESLLNKLIESNKMLVETNRDLTGMLKQSYYSSTSLSSDQHISGTLLPFLQQIALGGAGRFWIDENVGIVELNKILLGQVGAEVKLGK